MAAATTNSQGGGGKIRVSQATIDKIKAMGMTAALKKSAGASPEMKEALTRMYGARRVAEATKAAAPAKYSAGDKSQPKPKTAAYAAGQKSAVSTKPAAKKGGMSTGAKVAGGVAAAGLLIASRGKAAGLASKLSPTVAKALGARTGASTAANVMGKKLATIKETAATKAASTAGRATAKAGKPVSQSQYDAMQAAAKAKGIKPPVKATPAKPAPKLTVKKATAGAGMGATTLRGDTRKKK